MSLLPLALDRKRPRLSSSRATGTSTEANSIIQTRSNDRQTPPAARRVHPSTTQLRRIDAQTSIATSTSTNRPRRTCRPIWTKTSGYLLHHLVYHPSKFHRPEATGRSIIPSSRFWLRKRRFSRYLRYCNFKLHSNGHFATETHPNLGQRPSKSPLRDSRSAASYAAAKQLSDVIELGGTTTAAAYNFYRFSNGHFAA